MTLLRTVAAFGPETDGPAAIHSGNMGDIVYALPTCRALGIERLVLNLSADDALSGRALTEGAARFLVPLLLAQPGLKRIELARVPIQLANGFGEKARSGPAVQGLPMDLMEPRDLGVDYVLDRFRLEPLDRCHLIDAHAAPHGAAVDGAQAYLTVPPATEGAPPPDRQAGPGPVVLSLTPRYRHLDAAFFADLLRGLPVVKVGSAAEDWTVARIPGDYVTSGDALELARLIASARLFVGNPSLPYAIAEGLKVPRLVDVPAFPLNAFPLGPDGWLLPPDPDRARDLLAATLEGRAHDLQALPPLIARPRPHRVGLRWRGTDPGDGFDDARLQWAEADANDAVFRARLDMATPPPAPVGGLRLDLDGIARRSGDGLLVTDVRLITADGHTLWTLLPWIEGAAWTTLEADAGNLLAPPDGDAEGLVLACATPHVWLTLPLPDDALSSLDRPVSLLVEGRRLAPEVVLRRLSGIFAHHQARREAVHRAQDLARADEVRIMQEEVELIRQTLSWRITRPLRSAKGLLADAGGVRGLLRRLRGGGAAPGAGGPPGVLTPPTSWSMGDYEAWLARVEPQLAAVGAEGLTRRPTISIVVPVYNPAPEDFRDMVASVRAQTYPNWELCLADDCSPNAGVRAMMEDAAASDDRIRIVFREQNGHIAAATNSAIALATGDFIGFLDQDDMLHPACLALVARHLDAHPDTRIVYTDEDKLENGRRGAPYFKPNWSYTLFQAQNFLNHFTAVDAGVVRAVGGLRPEFNGAQDFDFLYRCLEHVAPDQIGHVPAVLYHWRAGEGSIASSPQAKRYVFDAGRRGLRAHLERKGVAAEVGEAFHFSLHRVRYARPETVSVSVCLVGGTVDPAPVRAWAAARPGVSVEILAAARSPLEVDGIRQLPADGHLYRQLARSARGDVVMVLSGLLEPAAPESLDELLVQALRPEIGAVGGAVLDDDDRMRHAGLVLDAARGVLLPYWGTPNDQHGSFGRLMLPHEVGAVAPFCLAARRDLMRDAPVTDGVASALGAALAFQHRLRADGHAILWTPHAVFRVSAAEEPLTALFGDGLPDAERARLGPALTDPIYHAALSRDMLYELSPSALPLLSG